jgi:hypothetical protein
MLLNTNINRCLVKINFIGESKMSTKDTLENMARNTWLAGLGSISSSKEAISKSIDVAQEKSNNLYNELLTRGEEIQNKINDTTDEIQAKGKKFLGIYEDKSHEEKLAELNTAVDHLTNVVVNLIEKRSAAEAAIETKPTAKVKATPKATTAKKPAVKATPKTATATKPAVKATPKTATATKIEKPVDKKET